MKGGILELAKRKNAVIKVTGACTLSREPYPFPDIWDTLARVFDAWGFDHCLWGTDWTRVFAVVNYEQAGRRVLPPPEPTLNGPVAYAKAYGCQRKLIRTGRTPYRAYCPSDTPNGPSP
jgi:hypothetical protein